MLCKICFEETDKQNGICSNCQASIISYDDIPPNP